MVTFKTIDSTNAREVNLDIIMKPYLKYVRYLCSRNLTSHKIICKENNIFTLQNNT